MNILLFLLLFLILFILVINLFLNIYILFFLTRRFRTTENSRDCFDCNNNTNSENENFLNDSMAIRRDYINRNINSGFNRYR